MKSKRSQTELIVTVLLVLIAIAAVAVIATFIIRNVRQGTEASGTSIQCLSLDFSIESALKDSSSISVRRNTGGETANITGLRVYVDGALANTTSGSWATLETKTIGLNSSLAVGQKVEIAAVLPGDIVCEVEDTKIVA